MNKSPTLHQLAIENNCDKADHDYLKFYSAHLPESPERMLEIGIEHGESCAMFQEYFPETELWYIDLFENPDFKSESWCHERGVKTFKCPEQDIVKLATLKEQFDVIINDASHVPMFQLLNFKQMFLNNLKSGGLFVIEDLASSLISNKWFWGSHTERFEDTTLYMFLEYLFSRKIINPYFTPEESEKLESMIESCDLYQGKIVFIKKK